MTMLIAVNFGDYGIIAADNSISCNKNGMLSIKQSKIGKSGNNVIATAGNAGLSLNVIKEISNIKFQNKDELIKIVNEQQIRTLKESEEARNEMLKDISDLSIEEKKELIEFSGGITSFLEAIFDKNEKAISRCFDRVDYSIYNSVFVYNIKKNNKFEILLTKTEKKSETNSNIVNSTWFFKENEFHILPPKGYCKDSYNIVFSRLKDLIKRKRNKTLEKVEIEKIFKIMATKGSHTTETCDIEFVE